MRHRFLSATLVAFGICLPTSAFAADDPKPTPEKPAVDQPQQPGRGGPGRGGRGQGGPGGGVFGGGGPGSGFGGGGPGGNFGGPGGPGGPGMNVARDPIDEVIMMLEELNFAPDFTLTVDQKTKIKQLRDGFKVQKDKWQADHEADFKKIQEEFMTLRTAGGGLGGGAPGGGGAAPDREKIQQVMLARQDLMDTAPKSDEVVAEIKGILTTEQLKMLDAKQVEHKAEVEKMRKEMMQNRGGPGGGGGGGRNGGGGGNGGGRGGADGGGAGGPARGNPNGI
jgi:hypothetical protein